MKNILFILLLLLGITAQAQTTSPPFKGTRVFEDAKGVGAFKIYWSDTCAIFDSYGTGADSLKLNLPIRFNNKTHFSDTLFFGTKGKIYIDGDSLMFYDSASNMAYSLSELAMGGGAVLPTNGLQTYGTDSIGLGTDTLNYSVTHTILGSQEYVIKKQSGSELFQIDTNSIHLQLQNIETPTNRSEINITSNSLGLSKESNVNGNYLTLTESNISLSSSGSAMGASVDIDSVGIKYQNHNITRADKAYTPNILFIEDSIITENNNLLAGKLITKIGDSLNLGGTTSEKVVINTNYVNSADPGIEINGSNGYANTLQVNVGGVEYFHIGPAGNYLKGYWDTTRVIDYVTAHGGSGIKGVKNGLTQVGDTAKLGGTITENTDLSWLVAPSAQPSGIFINKDYNKIDLSSGLDNNTASGISINDTNIFFVSWDGGAMVPGSPNYSNMYLTPHGFYYRPSSTTYQNDYLVQNKGMVKQMIADSLHKISYITKFTNNNGTTAFDPAIKLLNLNPATNADRTKYSPSIVFRGNAWGTTGSVSVSTYYRITQKAATSTSPNALLSLEYSVDSSNWTQTASFGAGVFSASNIITGTSASNYLRAHNILTSNNTYDLKIGLYANNGKSIFFQNNMLGGSGNNLMQITNTGKLAIRQFTDTTHSVNILGGLKADTLMGSSASGGNLIIQSTSNATKGNVYLAGTSNYINEATGKLIISGDMSYNARHAFLSKNTDYTPAVTQNIYTKILPTYTVVEASNITCQGDSATIVTPGDYYVNANATINGANGDDFTFQIRLNNAAVKTIKQTTSGATNHHTFTMQWYFEGLAANDDISFWVTNTSSNGDPTIENIDIYLTKEHD